MYKISKYLVEGFLKYITLDKKLLIEQDIVYCKYHQGNQWSLNIRFCVTTDVYFVQDLGPQILAWRRLYTAWAEFPRPNKIDRFVHNDGDRKSELLSLSLR